MFPGGNGNADLGYNKHAHGHGHGHGHSHNQFLAQPPPPPPHFSLPAGGGPGIVNPGLVMATSLPLAMQGGAGIDWAQLAQQWIHMRDAGPAAGINMPVSACPPPPVIGNVRDYHQQTMAMPLPSVVRAGYPILEEHGEADMDMDDDVNERAHGPDTPPPPAPVVTQSQWLAVNETPAISVPATSEAAATLGKQQWSNWHTQPGKATTSTGNPTAHIPSLLKLNVSNPNEPHQQLQLQPSQQAAQPHQLAAHQQHQQQQSQLQHPQHAQHLQHLESGSGGGAASSEIDANKRKMLPAWIREGLEKMEREKQRQLERQQSSSSHVPSDTADAETDVHVKQVSSKTLTTPVNLLNISNVASDSEDSIGLPAGAAALVGELKEQQIGNELLSKAAPDGGGGSSSSDEEAHIERNAGTQAKVAKVAAKGGDDVNGKNYEERLADLMLVVRRTLTEILLETTNEEITAIAGETLKAHRAKASSAQVIRKSALSSITGNLGLAAYGDSSSESEEDEDDEEDGERQAADAGKDVDKSVHLSAEELKARIRRSKRSFERVIDDIEDRVAKQERRDEQTLQRHRKRELEQRSDAASEQRRLLANPDSLGDTAASRPPHEKLQQYNGKRPSRKERTTRFSDNKDGKQQAHSYVQQVVAAAATVAPLPSVTSGPPKLKPVPNPATNLLQMPESVATMLSAADKALNKVNKSSSRKSKSKRRHSSTSSSTSSSGGGSSSSSSDSDDSSNSNSDSGSKTSSSRSKRSTRHGHHRSHGSSSRSKYSRRDHHRERERERDRNRDRRHDRHHYSGGGSGSSSGHRQGQRRHRGGSSHSAEDDGGGSSSYHRSSRQSSSRGHDQHGSSTSTSGRQRHRTRSRSKSRSTHQPSSNAYTTSSSSASHSRKRH